MTSIPTSAALLAVLGPSLSNTLGLREGVVVLLLLSDMVFEFSTVTFRLILDILQGCVRKTARHQHYEAECSVALIWIKVKTETKRALSVSQEDQFHDKNKKIWSWTRFQTRQLQFCIWQMHCIFKIYTFLSDNMILDLVTSSAYSIKYRLCIWGSSMSRFTHFSPDQWMSITYPAIHDYCI